MSKATFYKIMTALIIFILFYPIIPLITSIFTEKNNNFQHIYELFLVNNSINTVFLLFFVALFSFIIAFSCSVLVTFYQFPFSKYFKFLLILPLTIPTYFGAYIYDKVFDYSGIINSSFRNILGIDYILSFNLFSFWGGVFIFTLFLFPYLFIVLISFFKKNMGELIEVARTLGTPSYRMILKIILPLAKFPIIAGISMIIMEVINDFGVTTYLGIQTFTLTIFKSWFSLNDIQTASQLSGYLVIIVFICLVVSKKYGIKKPVNFLPSKVSAPITLSKCKAFLATAFCFFIFFISYLLPLLILLYYSQFAFASYPISDIFVVLGQSLALVIIATLVILIIGLFIAYQTKDSSVTFHTEAFSIQYALPSLIIAVSILNMFFQIEKLGIIPKGSVTVLQNAFIILIYAYTMRFIIIGYNISMGAFRSLGNSYQEVARTLGYSRFKSFFKIELPIILPSLLISSSIIIIDLFKELPLTLFLSPFNFSTPITKTYTYVANEMFTESTPSAITVIIILTIFTYILYYYGNLNKEGTNEPSTK